jgi:hypothetical protein
MGRTQRAQGTQRQRRAGGTIGIEITDDEQSPALAQSLFEQGQRRFETGQQARRLERRQSLHQLIRCTHATRGIDARQHRMQARQRHIGGNGALAPGFAGHAQLLAAKKTAKAGCANRASEAKRPP